MSERALKTRAKIMDATRAFIVREGVGRLSIDKIVKESGTSKGAFLYHFKNRKALFCALVEEYVDHLNERMNFSHEQVPRCRGTFDPRICFLV